MKSEMPDRRFPNSYYKPLPPEVAEDVRKEAAIRINPDYSMDSLFPRRDYYVPRTLEALEQGRRLAGEAALEGAMQDPAQLDVNTVIPDDISSITDPSGQA